MGEEFYSCFFQEHLYKSHISTNSHLLSWHHRLLSICYSVYEYIGYKELKYKQKYGQTDNLYGWQFETLYFPNVAMMSEYKWRILLTTNTVKRNQETNRKKWWYQFNLFWNLFWKFLFIFFYLLTHKEDLLFFRCWEKN